MPELISLNPKGAHVVADSIFEKLNKKNLSASMVTGLEGCEVRWLADGFVIGELVEQEPDNPARRGNIFHSIMEFFFALPPEERTVQAMKAVVTRVLKSEDYRDIGTTPDVIQWTRDAINAYYNMGGKPQEVEIAQLDYKGKVSPGLEIFVKGKIGNTKRPILGFVDQVIVDPTRDDGSVIVQDWKTGAKAKVYKPANKGEDGLAEQRQQIIYSELLRAEGIKVSGARLVYPVARKIVPVDMGDEKLRERVIADVEATDQKLTQLIEDNHYEFKPSFLCPWCPLSKLCPVAQIKPYAKMQEAYAKQPGIEILSKGVDVQ